MHGCAWRNGRLPLDEHVAAGFNMRGLVSVVGEPSLFLRHMLVVQRSRAREAALVVCLKRDLIYSETRKTMSTYSVLGLVGNSAPASLGFFLGLSESARA